MEGLARYGRVDDYRVSKGSGSLDAAAMLIVLAGQRIFGESGPRWLHLTVTLAYTAIDVSQRSLRLEVQMPLGIAVREELSCSPISDRQCRVNYHCHFSLPSGWRGALLRLLMRREFRVGPVDSLRRLKQAAERRFTGASGK